MSKYLMTTMAVMALVAAQMAAMAVETGLAGVKLGVTTPQQLVSRLGNPTMVQVNDGRAGTGAGGAATAMPGMGGMGGSTMPLIGGLQSAVQGYAGALNSAMGGGAPTMPGMSMPGMSMPGMSMPGMGGSSMPGLPGMPGMGGMGGSGGTQQRGMSEMQQPGAEVLMIYETSGHKMRYEFLFNRTGKLKQISVYGYKDLRGLKNKAVSRTSLGVGLGDQLKKVVTKYGMPNFGEYRKNAGQVQKVITFVYLDKHLALQFVKNSVAAIVVCLDKPTKYSFESPGWTTGQMAVAQQGGMGSSMPGMGSSMPGMGVMPGMGGMPGGSSMPSMPGMMPPGMGGGSSAPPAPIMPPGMVPPIPNSGR